MRIRQEQLKAWDETNLKLLNSWLVAAVASINSVEFGNGTKAENVLCDFQNIVTDDTPDAEFEVTHGLKRTPIGTWFIRQYNSGNLYFSVATTATSAKLYLKCDTASVTGTIIII